MRLSSKFTLALALTTTMAAFSSLSFADETVKDKAKEAGSDMSRGAKKMGRDVSDKTCEMVNGKMECAAKKVKHGVQNAADKMEDAAD